MKHFKNILMMIIFTGYTIANSGEVYLVIGSDTAIWEGMSTGRYHCYYDSGLYTNPSRNAYGVMDPAYRLNFTDSYGTPLKMTWWMMGGNIFRYADNLDVPIPNTMTMSLMKKYHSEQIAQYDDELSLHYHTFTWTDYDGDGRYWWNQAKSFLECYDDFNFTLCQLLLEDEIFPVSFRSGWHYMDNDWQHYLNEILPYSMHNAWPGKRTEDSEPIDNIYDWSEAPQEFVPYHPAQDNYQVPGDSKGWNVRSIHFGGAIRQNIFESIFASADAGTDQVACIWGHLPESDFLENIAKIDSLAHLADAKYPDVNFRYCSAVEAMQRWQQSTDQQKPQLDIDIDNYRGQLTFTVTADEPLFQDTPFMAVKDIYENYFVLPLESASGNSWVSKEPVAEALTAKVGVAVCDLTGNQSIEIIRLLPDDEYIDNQDEAYSELSGAWENSTNSAWGTDSRICNLNSGDTVKSEWQINITADSYYNVFIQIPQINNPAAQVSYKIYSNGICSDSIMFTQTIDSREWVYLSTPYWKAGEENLVRLIASGNGQDGKTVAADVLKISALVKEFDLHLETDLINLGEVSQNDTVTTTLKLYNKGYKKLTISSIRSANQYVYTSVPLPLYIEGMQHIELPVRFYSEHKGSVSDTLYIGSNDPLEPIYKLAANADVQSYFIIVDDTDTLQYHEYGNWQTSVAQAHGNTSRFAWLHEGTGNYAVFEMNPDKSGVYDIYQVVPPTTNATDKALYTISRGGTILDSVRINQNENSGNWVFIGRYYTPGDAPFLITVENDPDYSYGHVLRCDAIKCALVREITDLNIAEENGMPQDFTLKQNYPNPFNPQTAISFYLPKARHTTLTIYDLNGKKINQLANSHLNPGWQKLIWDGRTESGVQTASGVFIYHIEAGEWQASKKMIKVK